MLAIRHGETAWNVETRMQGQLDLPLNATGRRQAERLARALAELGLDEVRQRWPEQARRWRLREPDFAPPGGESLRRFSARCVATARRLAAAHAGQLIALVAHGGVLDCLYREATRLELQAPRTWQLGNAGINRLLYTPGGFTLVGWSDTQHLDDIALDEADGSDGPPPRLP